MGAGGGLSWPPPPSCFIYKTQHSRPSNSCSAAPPGCALLARCPDCRRSEGWCLPRERGALGPRLPTPLARAGAEVGRGRPPVLSLPAPLLSSRQAAIGLLLHDCPLHRVPETLLPAAIFKIPPARPRSLSPHGEGSSSYRSVPAAATAKPAGGPGPRTRPRGVARCPLGPSETQVRPIPSGPWCPFSPIGRGSSWGRACQWRKAAGAHMRKHTWWVLTCLLSSSAAQNPNVPTSVLTTPSLPHQFLATPGVGRQLGQACACGSPGLMRQAGDRSTEFFKALMEPASPDLGPGTRAMSQGPLPRHCSCFLFQV